MKWFHHDVESYKDPFIEWLMDNHEKGYQVFFVLLEMMAEKFRPDKAHEPITLRLKTIMERTRVKKIDHLRDILESFSNHSLNKNTWTVKFLNDDAEGFVLIYSKKLVDCADEYTKKAMRKSR